MLEHCLTQVAAGGTPSVPAGGKLCFEGLLAGARRAAPLVLAVAVNGVAFAALARSAGLGDAAVLLMSATVFAGSAQFAALSLLSSGASVVCTP